MKKQVPDFAIWAGVAALYFAGGELGRALPYAFLFNPQPWPCAGVALAALLLLGNRVWPGVLLGSAAVNFLPLFQAGTTEPLMILGAVVLTASELAQAFVGAWLARKFAGGCHAFRHPERIVRFVVLSAWGATLVTSVVATGIHRIIGSGARGAFEFWVTWWLTDMAGVLVVTPFLVAWFPPRRFDLAAKRVVEAGLMVALLLFVWRFAFLARAADLQHSPLVFLMIPISMWSGLRLGLRVTVCVSFLVSCLAIAAGIHSDGPFFGPTPNVSLLLLHNYVVVITIVSLIVAADVHQRLIANDRLRDSEQRYRLLFEGNPQPVWVCDRETSRFLAVNDAAVRHYGYPREEYLKLTLKEMCAEGEMPGLSGNGAQPAASGSAVFGCHLRKKDGTVVEAEIATHELVFAGRPATIQLCTDITERNRAERRAAVFSELGHRLSAANSAREAAQMIAEAADSLFGWDACCLDLRSADPSQAETVFCRDTVDGVRTEVAPAGKKAGPLMLKTLEEGPQLICRGEDPGEFLPGEQPFGDRKRRSACIMLVPVHKDGRPIGVFSIHSYRPNAYSQEELELLKALGDHCGGALERIHAAQEIQRLNRELRRHLEELQTIFEAAPVGLAVARDPECRAISGNAACSAIVGLQGLGSLSQDDAAAGGAKPFQVTFYRGEHALGPEELPMRVAARTGRPMPPEQLEIRFPDGRSVSSYVSASPLYDDGGQVRGSLGVFVDLTERRKAEAALHERDERLRLALTASRMGTWTLEMTEPPRLFSSPELEAIFGFPAREFAGPLDAFVRRVHSSDVEMVRAAMQRALRQQGDYEIEFRFLPRRREMGWLLVRGRPYPAEPGKPKRLAGVGIDITAHKQAEQEVLRLNAELERRVLERTAQLQAINKELEAFSYSVSHDLRAPLRSIRGFSEVLLQRYAGSLDARGQEFLRRAVQSSEHMDKLIDDLLQLSRVGRAELCKRPVNLSALAQAIEGELRQAEPSRQVEFVSAPNAHTMGDERLLRLVMENLLRNAWKFTGRTAHPRVEFGVTNEPEGTFFVRDNGAGFDMAYVSRLFGVFQRLHSSTEFPGTGVGLATVQRIINRHGGRVWAEGAVGQGATIYFNLPSHEEH